MTTTISELDTTQIIDTEGLQSDSANNTGLMSWLGEKLKNQISGNVSTKSSDSNESTH